MLAVLGALSVAASAEAAFIQLSEVSSNPTPASEFKALLDFQVVGDTFTLIVDNQTDDVTSGYNMNEIFFNSTSDVLDLVLVAAFGSGDGDNLSNWTLHAGPSKDTKADGFGRFTWALTDGVDSNPSTVMPGEVQTFTFDIVCVGAGLCDDIDFVTDFSKGGGNTQLAAAKFVSGPGGNSGHGASINSIAAPEPSLLTLICVGLLGALASRRRQRR